MQPSAVMPLCEVGYDWVWGTLGRKWQLGDARGKVSQYPEHTMIDLSNLVCILGFIIIPRSHATFPKKETVA